MMAEAEAQNGIFAPDEITYAWYRAKGMAELPYPPIAPGADARLRDRRDARPVGDVVPMIAKPFSPGNAFPAEEVARERITFDKALHRLVHQRQLRRPAAGRARAARRRARRASTRRATRVRDLPRLGRRRSGRSRQPDPRLGGESIADVFRVGRRRRSATRGAAPASARAPTRSQPGQRAITTFNRNWQNRMGVGGEGYLASPAVVAASALLGYMAPPSELGLAWDPERYGV